MNTARSYSIGKDDSGRPVDGVLFYFLVRGQGSARVAFSSGHSCGAVLMEVILALILFVGAAAILTGGMNASIQTLDRTRLRMHASNLAVTIMSELQMGLRSATTSGEEPFDAPYEEWTWEVVASDVSLTERMDGGSAETSLETGSGFAPARNVEVIIRHGFQSIVHRLVQAVPIVPLIEPGESAAESLEAIP